MALIRNTGAQPLEVPQKVLVFFTALHCTALFAVQCFAHCTVSSSIEPHPLLLTYYFFKLILPLILNTYCMTNMNLEDTLYTFCPRENERLEIHATRKSVSFPDVDVTA